RALLLAIADGGIVNDGVESAERVDLGRQGLGSGDPRKVSNTGRFVLGWGFFGVRRSRVVTRMQDDLVPLIGEKVTGHQSEAVGRTGDEDARHGILLCCVWSSI